MLRPSDLELLSVADACQCDLWCFTHGNFVEFRALEKTQAQREREKERKRNAGQQAKRSIGQESGSWNGREMY